MRGRRALLVGIYKITSPSGKVYIGQSWNILERWRSYKSSYPLRSQPKLASSIRKYGAANHSFEIVAWFSAGCNQTVLDDSECHYIAEYQASGIELLNVKEGGRGGRPSPESTAKMVATRRARGSYIFSDEIKRRMSDAQKGKPGTKHSEETKRRLAELSRGKTQSPETKERNRQSQLGRKHSLETKTKIGDANRGNKRPDLAAYNRIRWAKKKVTGAGA